MPAAATTSPNSPNKPVLVFGSDTSAFLGTVRSLGRAGIAVHAAGCSADSPAGRSRYITAHHEIPLYQGDGSAWTARIAVLIAEHDYSLLIPTSDSSLAQLDAQRMVLGEARLAIASHEALTILSDKEATRSLAASLGVPVPPGRLAAGSDNAAALVREFGLPLIAKTPRSYSPGDARQKIPVALCESAEELAALLAREDSCLVERFVPGFCRGVSVIAKDGEVRQAFQHRRLRQHHRTGPSSWRLAERLDPALLDAVRRIIAATSYTGVAMFEFRFADEGDAWVLLEVNPRFWGSMQLAMDAGADYPATLHAMLVDGLPPPVRLGFAPGFEKYSVCGEYESLAHDWAARGPSPANLVALVRFLAALVLDRRFDSYAADDPAPFHAERREILARLRARLKR